MRSWPLPRDDATSSWDGDDAAWYDANHPKEDVALAICLGLFSKLSLRCAAAAWGRLSARGLQSHGCATYESRMCDFSTSTRESRIDCDSLLGRAAAIVEVVDGRGKLKLKERLPTNSEIERDFYG